MQADSASAADWTGPDVRVRSCVQIIAVVFEQVKGFIFDFPLSRATRWYLLDIVTVDLQIGDETIAVSNFTIAFSHNLNR